MTAPLYAGTDPVCRRCGRSAFERLPRRGFLQRRVLSLFHRYPWRCALCNDITYRPERKTKDLSPESPFRDHN